MTKNLKPYAITYCNIKCDRFISLRSKIVTDPVCIEAGIELLYDGDDKYGTLTINNIDKLSDTDKNPFAKLIATTLYP